MHRKDSIFLRGTFRRYRAGYRPEKVPAVQPPYYWEWDPPTPKAPQMTPHMAVPPPERTPRARDHEGPPSKATLTLGGCQRGAKAASPRRSWYEGF